MTLKRPIRIAAILACLALLPAARAEDAKSVFDSLFAAKIKSVSATADRADDVALAKDMLALAKTSANQPGLVALLCDAAHDLGARHADGYTTAAEAMTLLAESVEEKRPAAREKLITLLTKQSAAGKPDEREAAGEALVDLLITIGDEKVEKKQYTEAVTDYRRAVAVASQKKSPSLDDAKAKMEFALSRDRTMKQLARLQEKLLKDANDSATAEEIVKLYVVELDDPESAKAYLNRVKDEQMKALVPLAAGAVDQVSEENAMKLGEWYKSLAMDPRQSQFAMSRSKAYLTRFLELHTASDILRTKAEVLLKEVTAALVAVPVAPAIDPNAAMLAKLLKEAVLNVTFDKATVTEQAGVVRVRDLSKTGAVGIAKGIASVEGVRGEAVAFKESRACVQFDGDWRFPKGVTTVAWVKFDDFANDYPHLISGEHNGIATHGLGATYGDARGLLTFYTAANGSSAVRSHERIKPGEWTFIATTFDGKTYSASVNDAKPATRNVDKDLTIPRMKFLRLGNEQLHGQYVLHGALDDVAIFPRALTTKEINLLYESGKKSR